jgi:putative MATE family efflux protein
VSTGSAPAGAHVRPGIWQLAFPTILSNLMFSMVAMLQTKFVGDLGPVAVAAVGAGQRVFFTVQALLMAISVGTTALIARAWGAGDRREASHVLVASMVIAAVVSAVITLSGALFAQEVASMFGLDAEASRHAADNVFWICAFIIGFAINIIVTGAMRAAGDAWAPLVFVAVVNLVNLPLLYVFIFGAAGMPRMEAAGAPFAQGLTLTIGGLILLALWMRQKLTIRFEVSEWRVPERYRRLLDIGYPAALEQIILQGGLFGFLALIGHFYGTEAFAAYNIGVNMLNVAMVVGFGFSIAGSTLVGQHLGAGDPEGARRSGWRSTLLAVVSMSLIAVVVVLNADALAHFFLGDQEQTVRHTIEVTYILAAMLPLLGIEFAVGGSLRGAGDTRFPLISTFVGLIAMRCGLAALFTWMRLPVVWVYGAIIGDYVMKSILLIWRFRSGRWVHAVH